MKYDRREFFKRSGAAFACTCLGSLCMHSCSPFSSISETALAQSESYRIEAGRVVLDLEKTPDLRSAGGSVKLEFNHPDMGALTKIILVHPQNTSYLAFSNVCTHRGKELEYDHPHKQLECVSGHSKFDLNGRVLKGNADAPLTTFPTQLKENLLYVTI